MPPVGFEPTISTGERTQTYALDRAATGTGKIIKLYALNINTLLYFLLKHKINAFTKLIIIIPIDNK